MNLQVIYVLTAPPRMARRDRLCDGRDSEKYLPKQYRRFVYFVCGPGPMMDAMEEALPELGVPPQNVHTERFEMV